jgi:hypothetical protein
MIRLHGEPSFLNEEIQRNPEASSGTKSKIFTSFHIEIHGLLAGPYKWIA